MDGRCAAALLARAMEGTLKRKRDIEAAEEVHANKTLFGFVSRYA